MSRKGVNTRLDKMYKVMAIVLAFGVVQGLEEIGMPPQSFIRQFAKIFSLTGIVFHCDLKTLHKEYLRHFYTSNPSVLLSEELHNPYNDCKFFNDLHVVLGDHEQHKILEPLFEARCRHDVWLFDVTSIKSMEDMIRMFSQYDLELRDDVYGFVVHENGRVSLVEIYKILKGGGEAQILDFGFWDEEQGLQVPDRPKWTRRSNLKGLHFKVTTLLSPPYVTSVEKMDEPEKVIVKGMLFDIFFALQELLNFTFSVYPPIDGEWGVKSENDSWTGMVQQLANKEVDIAVTDFTVTRERSEVIDFSTSFSQIFSRFFIKNPANAFNYLAFIQPLEWSVWITVLIIIIVSPPLLFMAMRVNSHKEEGNLDEFSLGKSYVFVTGAMTFARPWDRVPNACLGKLVFLCIIFAGSFVFWHWEAMLISYLASRVIKMPFSSLKELTEKSSYNIMTSPGSSFTDTFRFSRDELWRKSYEKKIEPYIESYPQRLGEMIDLVVNDDSYSNFAIYDNFYSVITYPAFINCEIVSIQKNYDYKPYAFGFQKDSPYLDLFDYFFKQMNEKGSLNQIVDKYQSGPQLCPDYSGQALGFANCFTAFIALTFGITLAMILFLLELFAERTSAQNGNSKRPLLPLRWINSYGVSSSTSFKNPNKDETISNLERRIKLQEYLIQCLKKRLKDCDGITDIHT